LTAVVAAAFPHWHPHPDVWLLVIALGVGYWWALRHWAPEPPADRADGAEVTSRRHLVLFATGLITIWVAADWPMHDLSEGYLYSAHMVQHLLLDLAVPPLLILGTPPWLLRRLLAPRPVMAVARRLTRPLPALLLFNAVIVLTHIPSVVDVSLRSEIAHFGLHAALVSTALLMWWPVLSPLPELPRLSPPVQMLYLFVQSLLPTIPAAWLTWASEPVYRAYANLPKLWGLSAVDDQRIAGLVMKIIGGLVLWGFIAAVFFRWAWREERTDRPPDVLTWDEVESELRRLGTPTTG
jgi:putative membrane protein